MIDHEREVLGQIAISKLNVNEIYANLKEKQDSNKMPYAITKFTFDNFKLQSHNSFYKAIYIATC